MGLGSILLVSLDYPFKNMEVMTLKQTWSFKLSFLQIFLETVQMQNCYKTHAHTFTSLYEIAQLCCHYPCYSEYASLKRMKQIMPIKNHFTNCFPGSSYRLRGLKRHGQAKRMVLIITRMLSRN